MKINDLLLITATIHENEIKEQRCIPKDSAKRRAKRQRVLRRPAQRVTRIKSQRNGYFDGHMCKRQKIGVLEIRKGINKMRKLRKIEPGQIAIPTAASGVRTSQVS